MYLHVSSAEFILKPGYQQDPKWLAPLCQWHFNNASVVNVTDKAWNALLVSRSQSPLTLDMSYEYDMNYYNYIPWSKKQPTK